MIALNRRQLLGAGALAGTGIALSAASPLGSATAFAATMGEATDPFDARLFAIARQQLERAGASVLHRDRVALADYSMPSYAPRFFIVNMGDGRVEKLLVTHGRGSDPEHDGWLKSFSNEPGSLASSRGAYVTGDYYFGKNGLSMRLKGLDPDNSHAEERAIVVHGAWYANPEQISTYGKLGRSEGCFAFPEKRLYEVLDRMGDGRLIYSDRLTA